MNDVHVPDVLPSNVRHSTFFSSLYNRTLGYAVYLPAGYQTNSKRYPVHYHFHGWKGCELSDIHAMEPVYQNREIIFVFPNISASLGEETTLPVEEMFFGELIPEIEKAYRVTDEKSISGFSMGGGMAVWFALGHPGVFSEVTAYAGTFHHYYHKDFMTAFVPVERAEELYRGMMQTQWASDRNLLQLFAQAPKDAFRLTLCIGTDDPLYCDAEVLHRHLLSLGFPHTYQVLDGVSHVLREMV